MSPVGCGPGGGTGGGCGGGLATVICLVSVSSAPPLSATWRLTVYVPAAANVWVTVVPVASNVPFPSRSQLVRAIVPSESVDVDVNVTWSPGFGAAGEYVKDACGGLFTRATAAAAANTARLPPPAPSSACE